MKYQEFTFQDFVEDAYFRSWIYQPDEASNHFWKNWLAHHPEKQADVDQARLILLSVQFKQYSVSDEEKSEVWNRIRQHRHATERPLASPLPSTRPRWKSRFVGSSVIAAALAMLVLVYSWWARSDEAVYTAEYGTTRTIILADQSTVELNANSTLRVRSLEDDRREVWLEGEAFFAIQPQTTGTGQRIPFLVHTDEMIIKVVGTEFNVLSRRGETQIGLRSGKVKLTLDTEDPSDLDMQPGDWVAFSPTEQQLTRDQVAPDAYTAWRDHRFLFDEHTLSEVKTMLEDYYGYSVRLVDAGLARRTFSGQFPADRLDLMLEAIRATLEVKITKTGQEILISRQ